MRLLRPLLALLLLASWLAAGPALAAKVPGEPLRRGYESDQTRARPGHLALATSANGELFTGNAEGVLRFNGIDWRLTTLPGRSPARALDTGRDGLVYVGGYDTFGRLAPNAEGGLAYEELLDAAGLVGDQRHLGFVYQVMADDEGVWFRTNQRLYFLPYDGGRAKHWPLGEEVRSFYLLQGRLLARLHGRGLARFDPANGRFELVPGGEAMANVPLPAVIERDDGLLLVARDGLHLATDAGVKRLAGAASRLLDGERTYVARELVDGSVVVGTLDGKLIRFDAGLSVRENLDLGNYGVIDLAVDREGGLWVATENDLLRLSLPSRWSLLGESQGIAGNPNDFEWHDGALWLATSQGIQRIDPSPSGQPRAERQPWTEYEAYALQSTDAGLLMGVREGLLVLDPGARAPRTLFQHPHHGVYALMPSRFRDDRMYALTGPNLMVLRKEGGRWQTSHTIDLGGISVAGIEEAAEGELWMGDTRGPVQRWRIDPETGEVLGRQVYDDSRGLAVNPQFGTSVYRFEDRIHATSGERGFRLEGDVFVADLAPPVTLVDRAYELAVEQTALGDYAYTSRELWHRPPNAREWQPLFPGGRGLAGYSYLRMGSDGVLRIATWTGLLQYDPGESWVTPHPLQLGMELVLARDAQGKATPLPLRSEADQPVLVPPGHSLTMRFAMVSMESGAQFRYVLHGVTPDWGEWADRDLFIRALPAGDYVLEVQARTGTGRQAPTMTYRFRVLPHWYEQWWVLALGLLALLGVGLLGALWVVRLRTERFREDNRRLEARIAERTHELEDANRRLAELATEDALTGVANRRALENGLRREWFRCLDQRRPLSVLMIDVDHFKAYNDAHGHLEGDVQLRGIAQRLSRQHDPQREQLARYGGEEFALLLPGVHPSEAARRAETIRAAIAASDAGMTVSIGVAGAVPELQAEPDSLLRRADAALYAAKRAGRNRVEVDAD
ncbi:diguanylate cyclase [Arenimonas caeni]|jgi:diguanylate cyclase (GGDEF)-like protein|uniref:ligand-binding sensor domain-containing diguanylate cyclase n=1 Tax=Arenimonas caeni TaxID=2058085 RepID=UPI002A36C88D|nr:diguanylate cyclase [Arenimonas caeni]MDY0021185.1 diguanylate cyclase [Arenimonas caeni]